MYIYIYIDLYRSIHVYISISIFISIHTHIYTCLYSHIVLLPLSTLIMYWPRYGVVTTAWFADPVNSLPHPCPTFLTCGSQTRAVFVMQTEFIHLKGVFHRQNQP